VNRYHTQIGCCESQLCLCLICRDRYLRRRCNPNILLQEQRAMENLLKIIESQPMSTSVSKTNLDCYRMQWLMQTGKHACALSVVIIEDVKKKFILSLIYNDTEISYMYINLYTWFVLAPMLAFVWCWVRITIDIPADSISSHVPFKVPYRLNRSSITCWYVVGVLSNRYITFNW